MGDNVRAVLDRVLNEPVLVTAVILAVGNLVAQDWTDVANAVESILVVIGGLVARSAVTPVRTLD